MTIESLRYADTPSTLVDLGDRCDSKHRQLAWAIDSFRIVSINVDEGAQPVSWFALVIGGLTVQRMQKLPARSQLKLCRESGCLPTLSLE